MSRRGSLEKEKARNAAWREANPDKVREMKRAYAHSAKGIAARQAWEEENRGVPQEERR